MIIEDGLYCVRNIYGIIIGYPANCAVTSFLEIEKFHLLTIYNAGDGFRTNTDMKRTFIFSVEYRACDHCRRTLI